MSIQCPPECPCWGVFFLYATCFSQMSFRSQLPNENGGAMSRRVGFFSIIIQPTTCRIKAFRLQSPNKKRRGSPPPQIIFRFPNSIRRTGSPSGSRSRRKAARRTSSSGETRACPQSGGSSCIPSSTSKQPPFGMKSMLERGRSYARFGSFF